LVLATLSGCVSDIAVAAECLTFDNGKLLSIISDKLERSTSDAQVLPGVHGFVVRV
jgi:hypothetical protein